MNLPNELLPHEDKILLNTDKWLILDGIDHEGKSNGINKELVYCLYMAYGFYVYIWIHPQIFKDTEFFWNFIRKRVANKLRVLRKEIEK